MRVDLDVRRRAPLGDRARRGLRQTAGERGFTGSRGTRQDDQTVRKAGHRGQRGSVQQGQKRVVEQPLLHPRRRDDVIPRPVVVVRGQHVNGQHSGRERSGYHGHVGLVTSGQSTVAGSPA